MGPSLNQVLAGLGLTTRPARRVWSKDILDGSGRVLFSGPAGEVWRWLRAEGLL